MCRSPELLKLIFGFGRRGTNLSDSVVRHLLGTRAYLIERIPRRTLTNQQWSPSSTIRQSFHMPICHTHWRVTVTFVTHSFWLKGHKALPHSDPLQYGPNTGWMDAGCWMIQCSILLLSIFRIASWKKPVMVELFWHILTTRNLSFLWPLCW